MLMDLFVLCVACLTEYVNCMVKQFAICLGVFAILLLNVMDLLSVVRGALLDIPYVYGIPKSVCVVPVIPVCIKVFLPYVLFMALYVGSSLPIKEFQRMITGVCSPYVFVSLHTIYIYIYIFG